MKKPIITISIIGLLLLRCEVISLGVVCGLGFIGLKKLLQEATEGGAFN